MHVCVCVRAHECKQAYVYCLVCLGVCVGVSVLRGRGPYICCGGVWCSVVHNCLAQNPM